MSHNVDYFTYAEKVNRSEVQKDLDAYVARADWQEGASGLPNRIRWIETTICDTEDMAMDFLHKNDRGWYDCLAVRFRGKGKPTKGLETAKARHKEAFDHYINLNGKLYSETVKSEYIGCKQCGSKLKSSLLKMNSCPLCGQDFRSETTLKAIETAKKKKDAAEKKVQEEQAKANKTGEIHWLVKIEYHT